MKVRIIKVLSLLAVAAVIALASSRPSRVEAQSVDFSADPSEFVGQMDAVFKMAQDKKKAKAFMKDLNNFMVNPQNDDQVKQRIIADCNLLRKKKARAFPDYFNVISVLMTTYSDDCPINGTNFLVWHEVLGEKMRTKNISLQKINNYINATYEYIDNGYIAKSNGAAWRTDAPSVSFRNEGNKLYIDVPKSRLVCYAQNDSIEILETEGVVDFDEKRWVGQSGVVTWERCGLDRQKTNATFGEYKLDLSRNFFKIDSVQFVNKEYFADPMSGTLEHKVIQTKSALGQSYPKFVTSGEHQREVKNIFESIDYHGGFSQIGVRFQGSGTDGMPAQLLIYRKDTLFITASSQTFSLYPDRIESQATSINVLLNDGEIHHPGLRFRYDDKRKEVTMVRGKEGMEKSRYFDTYHNVTFDVEQVKWKVGDMKMTLGMVDGASRGVAIFESLDYYRAEEYDQLQGMAMEHPFQAIKDFYNYYGGSSFLAEEYASFMHQDVHQVRMQFLAYAEDSFLEYNEETDMVTPTSRLFKYLDNKLAEMEADDPRKQRNPSLRNPRLKDVDYDVMMFESVTTEYDKETDGVMPNGIIDLGNYDMKLNGVSGIAISDFQNVAFYPEGQLFLKKNRDFEFGGKIMAGMVMLEGSNFYFSYDDYNIKLERIDAMKMKVYSSSKNAYGQVVKADVTNTICNLTGFLQIDEPNNKSGLRGQDEKYPQLTSTKEAFVYYDNDNVQDGQYKRDKFYFTVDPFVFNDMNNIRYNNTHFSGVLTSGIFPDMRQDLVIRQKDNSLGFVKDAPEEGYPVYNGKATFFAQIDLSNDGLKGIGDLRYLASLSSSRDFTFLPDLAYGETYNFRVDYTTSGTPFPGAYIGKDIMVTDDEGQKHGGTTDLEFYPNRDKLNVYNTMGKFNMFPNEERASGYDCILDGGLSVTPRGLRGVGEAVLPFDAHIEASIMDFTDHSMMTDTTYFAQYQRNKDNGMEELVSDGLRRDLCKDSRDMNSLYNRIRTGTTTEPNDALNENETFLKIIERKDGEQIQKHLHRKAMIANIDFDSRMADFTYKNSLGGEKNFTYIKFKSYVKHFTWNMQSNEQTIGSRGSKPGLPFICTKRERDRDVEDSLRFYVPYATYNATTNVMFCEEVETIKCADAKVTLSDGFVNIREDAKIDRLKETTIDLKSDSSYHRIYEAWVDIEGAVNYRAGGKFDFVNKMNETTTLFMDSIMTNKETYRDWEGHRQHHYVTTAVGHRSQDLFFDEHFAFKGEMAIKCGRQLLEWNGGARTVHEVPNGPHSYAYFRAVVDPQKVRIPIKEQQLIYKQNPKDRHEIFKDFFIRKDSVHVYSSFLETRIHNSDISIMSACGTLYYNDKTHSFDITSDDKIAKPDTTGSILRYIPSENAVVGFGLLETGVSEMMGKKRPFDITAAGDVRDDRNINMQTMSAMMNIDFTLHDELATMIYNKILGSDAPKCDSTNAVYEYRMREMYDTTTIAMINKQKNDPLDEKTHFLPSSGLLFTFDKVFMTWLTQEKAYICDTTVNLMLMRGRSVNRQVRIKAEFTARKTNPAVNLLLSTVDGYWLYMYYRGGHLYISSSDKDFNNAMQRIPIGDRTFRSKNYIYTLANDSKRKTFLNDFDAKTVLITEMKNDTAEDQEEEEQPERVPDEDEGVIKKDDE